MLLEARVPTPVTEAEAVRMARELYGLEASAQALPGEYDDNFHLTCADGRAFVLKVMHPARERSFIDMQCQALHIWRSVRLNSPCRAFAESQRRTFFFDYAPADGSTRLVWLLTFVTGTVLAKVRPHAPELLGDLGRFLGEMDAALHSFSHPAAHRELKWDSSRAAWIKELRSAHRGFEAARAGRKIPRALRIGSGSGVAAAAPQRHLRRRQ